MAARAGLLRLAVAAAAATARRPAPRTFVPLGRAAAHGRFGSTEAGAAGSAGAVPLRDRLREDLKRAMREKQKERTTVIRSVLSALTYADKATGAAVDEDGAVQELRRLIKRHEESIAQFEAGGRADLAAREREQMDYLTPYLPQQLSAAQLEDAVREAIARLGASSAKDMGRVMQDLSSRFSASVAPRKTLSDLVKQQLAKAPAA